MITKQDIKNLGLADIYHVYSYMTNLHDDGKSDEFRDMVNLLSSRQYFGFIKHCNIGHCKEYYRDVLISAVKIRKTK